MAKAEALDDVHLDLTTLMNRGWRWLHRRWWQRDANLGRA